MENMLNNQTEQFKAEQFELLTNQTLEECLTQTFNEYAGCEFCDMHGDSPFGSKS
jgi:hypothetical protein